MWIIIFCQENDLFAEALYLTLLQKEAENVRMVTATELAFACWQHEAGSNGLFFTRIRLRDGFSIEPAGIKKAVNRLYYFQLLHFINPADRSYAEMEMYALYSSFLRSIENKVIDGMPVEHMGSGADTNNLFFYAMAVKSGMNVLNNQFTSSPRWWRPEKMNALAPSKKAFAAWHRHSPHLVWENKPVLYTESFAALIKVEVVKDKMFWPGIPVRTWQKKINIFSGLIGRTVFVLTLAAINGRYKFYAVDIRPATAGAAVTEAFADLLISKKRSR